MLPTRLYIILSVVLLLNGQAIFSQDKKKMDSLVKVLETHQQDSSAINAYCELATELLGTDDRLAKQYAFKAQEISQKINRPDLEAWAKNLIGLSFDYLGIADSALLFYHGSIDIKRRLNDTEGIGATTMNIGVLYYYQNDHEKAIEYYNKAMELYKQTNNEKRMAGILNNLGAVYREQEKYKEAIEVFNESYRLKLKTNDSTGMSNALGNLGIVYQHMGQYKKAEDLMWQSLKIDIASNNRYNQLSSFVGLADLKILQQQYGEAKSHLEKAIELGKGLDAAHYLDDAYRVYTKLDSLTGDHRSAYAHLQQYYAYSDMVKQDERKKQLDRLETVYQTKEKENQIELLNANAEIKNLQLQKQKKQILTFIAISASLLIGLLLFIIGFRSIRRAKKQLEEKNQLINQSLGEKEMLLKEIHHRVKNNLQTISSLLSIQSRYIKDEKALETINESMERVNAISLLHQEIYRNEVLRSINARDYFSNLASGLQQTFDPHKKIDLVLDLAAINADVDQLIPLGLIVNELLTNAYKYGTGDASPWISFSSKQEKGKLVIRIHDNGAGYGNVIPGQSGDSLGYKLIHLFAAKLKGTVDARNNNGAEITISCQLRS